ncbi:hypothetical protein D3C83_44770 [compost metagenome]
MTADPTPRGAADAGSSELAAAEGVRDEIVADQVFLLTGYHPDVDLMRRAGIRCDEQTLAPDMNPETFETNVPNLFIVDGSSFVTSGRGQPTLTIQALAFRAADHIGQFAKRGEI